MKTPGAVTGRRVHGSKLYFLYLTALAVALVGNLVLRMARAGHWLSPPAQVALAVASAFPLIVAALLFWRLLRGDLDEMLQRIVLEGMAFAFVVYLPLAAMWMNLEASGIATPRLDAPDVVLTPAVLMALGIAISIRRYS